MFITPPVTITDAILTASNLTENDTDDAPVWAAGSQTVGQFVRRATTHRVYECLIAHSAANIAADYPENNLAGNTPKWQVVRPTNKWACFDNVIGSSSEGKSPTASTITYTLTLVDIVDTMNFYKLDADTVRVKQTVSGVTKTDVTLSLRLKNCRSWSDFFFKTISRRTQATFKLAPYKNSVLEITITKPSGTAKVGEAQVGRSEYIGDLLWAPEVRVVDFSGRNTNTFGTVVFVKRQNVPIMSCEVFVENTAFDEVVRLLRLYTSVPLGVVGDERYDALIDFCFVQDFRVVLESPAGSHLSIQFQGLT